MEQRPIRPELGIQASPNAAKKGRRVQANGPGAAGGSQGQGVQQAGQAKQGAKQSRDAGVSGTSETPAFHVLLERLSRSAQELQENAERVERPSDLAGAMGRAKESLADALELGDQLLEAWRAERMNPTPTKTNETDR